MKFWKYFTENQKNIYQKREAKKTGRKKMIQFKRKNLNWRDKGDP